MKSKIIKSKRIGDGTLDLFEFTDSSDEMTGYSVVKSYSGEDISSGHSGAAKLEETNFDNKQEAINFFNNQN